MKRAEEVECSRQRVQHISRLRNKKEWSECEEWNSFQYIWITNVAGGIGGDEVGRIPILFLSAAGFRIERKVKLPGNVGPKPCAPTESCQERCVTCFLSSPPTPTPGFANVSCVNSFHRKLRGCLMEPVRYSSACLLHIRTSSPVSTAGMLAPLADGTHCLMYQLINRRWGDCDGNGP